MNTETQDPEGRDQGKKRKVDSDGFVRPFTPEIFKKPNFMHTAHSVEGGFDEEGQNDTTSEYFHQIPEHLKYITDYQEEHGSTVNKDNSDAIQDYSYEGAGTNHAISAYLPEENYTPDRHLQSKTDDRADLSQEQHLDKLQEQTQGDTMLQYGTGENGESSVCNYPQQQQPEQCQTTVRPTEGGDAATSHSAPVDEALRRWREETDQLFDYWSNIFRISQDYEVKTVDKLGQLLSTAKALDQRILQQREAVMQRVKGIGKILELQNK